MSILCVENLCKAYPGFCLKDVSFRLEKGHIMGFIGRNGAGKTTTIKSILGLCHPDSGMVYYFQNDFADAEEAIKQRIGYASGANSYYKKKKLKEIVAVTKLFYKNWDDKTWKHYLEVFALDENKRPEQLSEGMKVKFNLALALSHGAELLILDEPTSGLDPVSRNELLEVFLTLAKENVTILFSTHIISDLEKCAEDITYIKQGRILFTGKEVELLGDFALIHGENLSQTQKEAVIGHCMNKDGDTWLISKEKAGLFAGTQILQPSLEEIMIHLEGGNELDEKSDS